MHPTLKRPNASRAETITATQFIHEWADTLRQHGHHIIDASRGRPTLAAPSAGLNRFRSYTALLESAQLAPYGTDTLGEPTYRRHIADAFTRDYGLPFTPEQIAFTPGGQFGLAAAFYAMLKACPNGRIITPCPWYLNHHELAQMALTLLGLPARKVFLPLPLIHADGSGLREQDITALRAQSEPIAGFLFCNPGNPLGNVLDEVEWQALAPLLSDHPNAPVLLDEAFHETLPPGHSPSRPLLQDELHRCFLFRSGTKALGFAGERLAVMNIPAANLETVVWLQSRLIGNPPISAQAVLSDLLTAFDDSQRQRIANYYQQNAQSLVGSLRALGCFPKNLAIPQGGFFTLADCSALLGAPMPQAARTLFGCERTHITDDWDIALALLAGLGQTPEEGIAAMPASCFGIPEKQGWLRLSFSIAPEEITLLTSRLRHIIAG